MKTMRSLAVLAIGPTMGLLLIGTSAVCAQITTPATRPDGTEIASSAVLGAIIDEARRSCVPIVRMQFTEASVELGSPKPDDLRALVARLGFDHGPTSVNVTATPMLIALERPPKIPVTSPSASVEVTASISINARTHVATMTGLPSAARNAITDAGGTSFQLAQWNGERWVVIGLTIDAPDAACPIGWYAPTAETSFASGSVSPVFHSPGWRTTRWPTWKVRLPAALPPSWYRLTTAISIAKTTGTPHAGGTFRVK